LFGAALIQTAELLISVHGPQGYAEVLWEMYSKDGLDIGANPGSLRDWLSTQRGWRKRYEAAVALFEARQAGRDPNDPLVRKLERTLKQKTNEASRLREQLKDADTARSAFEMLADTLEGVVTPLVTLPYAPRPGKKGHPVDFVVALSDQHADAQIEGPMTWGLERYNYDIFCLRLERWQRLIIEYGTGQHLPEHRVERLHIFSLGDALHGDIHDHKHQNHFGNTMRAAVAVADAQAEAIAGILEHIPYVNLVGVSGNHPRTTARKNMDDPHDNFDFMVLALMQARLSRYIAEKRLDIHVPRAWSAFVNVRGKVMALNHGDDVRGTWGIPWYGFSRKASRVQSLISRQDARVDYFWYGHYHTDVGVTEAGARNVHSGAFTFTDPYAMTALNAGGEPMQTAMMIDDSPGMRSRIVELPIWLRDEQAEDAYWKGKRTPKLGRHGALSVLGAVDAVAGGGQFPLIHARK